MVQEYSEDSGYAFDALQRIQRAKNDDRELKPNEIKTYSLTIPEDVNNVAYVIQGKEFEESFPTEIVEIGNLTFTISCAEGVKETFVFD